MAYLESRRFVHRDLACRNVLLPAAERVSGVYRPALLRVLPDLTGTDPGRGALIGQWGAYKADLRRCLSVMPYSLP